MRLTTVSGAIVGLVLGLGATTAHADAAGGLLINHTIMQPGNPADTKTSTGFGAEWGVVSTNEPYMISIGAFMATAGEITSKRGRNIYDLRLGFGFKPPLRRAEAIVPFVGAGVDILYVSTRLPSGALHAGPTLGASVRVGVFGVFGRGWIYQVSLSYVGGVAPGIHDNINGAALQLGIGRVVFGL